MWRQVLRSLIKCGLMSGLLLSCGVQGEKVIGSAEGGQLSVQEKNGLAAEIFVDGEATGLHTPAIVQGLTPGKHQITLWLSGYTIAQDSVLTNLGQSATLDLQLAKLSNPIELNLQTLANAEVRVDGILLGQGSSKIPGLAAGKHQISVQLGNRRLDTLLDLSQQNSAIKLEPQAQSWVLLEHFSNIACMPCPSVDRAVETFLHVQNNPRIVHMAMHTNSPSPEDLFYTPFAAQIDERVGPKYYAVASVPRVMLNGVKTGARQDSAAIPQYLSDSIPVRLKSTPGMSLALSDVQMGKSEIKGTLNVEALAQVEGRVKIALVEDEIHFNSAPGINGLSDFVHMFSGFANLSQDQLQLSANAQQKIAFSFNTPRKIANYSIVAWVENPNTKSVLQVYKQSLAHFSKE